MLNKIWFGLLAIGLVYGFGRAALAPPPTTAPPEPQPTATQAAPTATQAQPATTQAAPADDTPVAPAEQSRSGALSAMGRRLTNAAIDSAQSSVEICIALIGMMALWLGIMKIAEDAGLVTLLARLLRPVLRWLFPDIPRDHPAGGAVVMNLAANLLGLDNAATPLGLKAMKELQALNRDKKTASDSMVMFLAINTSSISLVAFTIVAYRKAAGSSDPASVIFATILATTCSTIAAILAVRLLRRFYPLRRRPDVAPTTGSSVETTPAPDEPHEEGA